ncbi:hypothetical protein CDL12_01380 [Handroanthus impetiginosus]|uniref:CUE domain-containing protein n=1 Tax=Handroanthus impetiginosus TaxID=429701 RepID=A0A2G9I7Y2_9LAMI|nr:hypothetical protein CDL12_01380 [Handroanthus impetiginosus]
MAFKDVYRALLDMFPQIDSRALRAVAIEHSKDFNAAVGAVFDDVTPFFNGRSEEPFVREILGIQTEASLFQSSVNSTEVQDSCNVNRGIEQFFRDDGCSEAYSGHQQGEHNATDLKLSEKTHEDGINLSGDVYSNGEPVGYVDKNGVVVLHVEASGDLKTKEKIPDDKFPESSIKISFGTVETQENDQEKSSMDRKKNFNGIPLTVFDEIFSHLESNPQSVVVLPDVHESDLEKLEVSSSTDTASNAETMSNIIGTKNEPTSNATMSQSSQTHIHVLDEVIANARNNKKTLFSTLESVINLMRQVELKEQAAELAKEEAAIGGLKKMNKVDELKRILKHANVGNQKHAGEVYGEKAILMTELRELHARVLSLSDERDKSLGVLDEMCQTLELQLAAAEDEIKAAEQEKLDKEIAAQILLSEQESIMEKIVQESKTLKHQTEENLKLQEFLVDRGRVVDMLQGEIAVICHAVKQLKEKFDETGLFSKSLSSSQIDLIKASSDSLSKSLIPDQMEPVPVGDDSSETQNEIDPEKISEDEASGDDRKTFLDDGWDFLDSREIEA